MNFSLIIIGGGPGGYTAAIRAAQSGLATALVEESDRLGGVCLNAGCIPVKSLLRSAEVYELVRRGDEFGLDIPDPRADFGKIMRRSQTIPQKGASGIDFLMKKNRVTVIHGRATLAGGGRVEVGGEPSVTLRADNIILATGAHPIQIPGIEPDGRRVLTSSDLLKITEQPASLLIIGAGAIGVQFASFFRSFGTTVTLVDIADRMLPGVDADISKRLAHAFNKRGITVKMGVKVESLTSEKTGCRAALADGTEVESEIVLSAVGYTGNVGGIGADEAGVAHERGFFTVDDRFRTSASGVYAIGDCIGPPMLAHAAAMEGERAVASILGAETARLDPDLVPIAIYSLPNVASVGLTEKNAREAGYDILTGVCPFTAVGKAVATGETEGLVKVIVDSSTRRFLGVHIIGQNADEIIQETVLAMHTGITADQLIATLHPHPTLVESVREATATALGRPLNL